MQHRKMPGPFSTREKIIITTGAVGLGLGTIMLIKYLKKRNDFLHFREELDRLSAELETVKNEILQLRGTDHTDTAELAATTSDEESSDSEYFDALEDIAAASYLLIKPSYTEQNGVIPSLRLQAVFQKVDDLLNSETPQNREIAYTLMQETCDTVPTANEDCAFLWRFARAAYLYGQSFLNKNEQKRKQLVFEAKDRAFEALQLNENDPDAHKWCALTLGTATDFLSLNDKIEKGYDFKIHIDQALNLRPDDPILHHLSGRWSYGVANLSWIERKVATTLFSEPPTSSYQEALDAFLEAEKLQPDSWAENLLYVGKCYLALSETEKALPYLKQTLRVPATGPDDRVAQDEAKYLLAKYEY